MLSEMERTAIAEYEPKRCPVCLGKTEFAVTDRIYALVEVDRDGQRVDRSSILPVVALECDSCHHLLLFSATTLGIVSAGTPATTGGEPEPER
jgi:hypothetical protein